MDSGFGVPVNNQARIRGLRKKLFLKFDGIQRKVKKEMSGFDELQLSAAVMKGIKDMGFTEPTPIQAQAIPMLFDGQDVIGQAKTGTGKTAAFGIYILEGLNYAVRTPQAVILTPTRELCVQVRDEIAELGKHTPLKIAAIYGGQEIDKQFRQLKEGVHVIVGTPGRVMDHLERGSLSFPEVRLVVIDEADRMLDMGFIDDVAWILAKTPPERQTLLFSATMPEPIKKLAGKYMHSPQWVRVSSDEAEVITHILQTFVPIDDPRERLNALLAYMGEEKPKKSMIFCRTKFGADKLDTILNDRGYRSEGLHGDLSQAKRDAVMKRFREGKLNVLVATDLAARGLDIDDVTHVINFNIPEDHTTYIHRVGRTGRMGKAGAAFTIVDRADLGKLGVIERAISVKMGERKLAFRKAVGPSRQSKHSLTRRQPTSISPVPHTYNL